MKQQIKDLTVELVKHGVKFEVSEHDRIIIGDVGILFWDRSGYEVFCNKRYNNVSQHDVTKHFKTSENNMFKLKITTLLQRIEAIKVKIAELDVIDSNNLKKKENFIEKMKSEGAKFWHGEFKKGDITRNGIEYRFEICDNGYISEELKLAYEWTEESKFDRFKKLSQNGLAK